MIGEEDTGTINNKDNYNFIQIEPTIPLGWKCPVCGKVWSPSFVGPCSCYQNQITYTITTSTYDDGISNQEEVNPEGMVDNKGHGILGLDYE